MFGETEGRDWPRRRGIVRVLLMAACLMLANAPAAVAGRPFDNRLNPEERLGRSLFKDEQLSLNRNQSCESCHTLRPVTVRGGRGPAQKQQSASFVDPDNIRNGTAVSDGSDTTLFGGLNAPMAGYAAFSPAFGWDDSEGLYIGGQFWNGRAQLLRDQAKGPFVNPVEMALPDRASVIARLQENREYLWDFQKVYGIDLAAIQTDGSDPVGVQVAYHAMSLAIEAFERSPEFNRFDSKFDFVENGTFGVEYTASEQRGADVFDAVCAACHEGTREDASGNLIQGLMTDFSYDNIGTPRNVAIPGNPEPDPGLAGNATVIWDGRAAEEIGKQKVMSLRNIELTPPYMHNGVLLTLEQVVHFYNSRDTKETVCADNNDPGFGVSCWPVAQFPATQSVEPLEPFERSDGTMSLAPRVGDMGMTTQDEADLVAYLKTFTDGYPDVPRGAEPGYVYLPSEIMPARPPYAEGSDR